MGSPVNDTPPGALLVGFLAIVKGYSNEEIGGELGISRETVKSQLGHLFRRLNVRSRAEAVARARELGVLRVAAGNVLDYSRVPFDGFHVPH